MDINYDHAVIYRSHEDTFRSGNGSLVVGEYTTTTTTPPPHLPTPFFPFTLSSGGMMLEDGHPGRCMKAKLQEGSPQIVRLKVDCIAWDCALGSFVVDAIRTSPHFQEISLMLNKHSCHSSGSFRVNFQFVHACVDAAQENQNIHKINLALDISSYDQSADVADTIKLAKKKLGKVEVSQEYYDENSPGNVDALPRLLHWLTCTKELSLCATSHGFFRCVMQALSVAKKPVLKSLTIWERSVTSGFAPSTSLATDTLPGIGLFFASHGAKKLETMRLLVSHPVHLEGMTHLTQGLPKTSIGTFYFSFPQLGEEEANLLSVSLWETCSLKNLKLHCKSDSTETQDNVSPLISKILSGSSHDNPHIRTFEWSYFDDESNDKAVTLSAENISPSQATKSIFFRSDEPFDIGLHIDSMLDSPVYKGLESLDVSRGRLGPVNTEQIETALLAPWFNLKRLDLGLCVDLDEADVLAILSAASKSCSLEELAILAEGVIFVTSDTLGYIADALSQLKLRDLTIAFEDVQGVEDYKGILLGGLERNETVERLFIHFGDMEHFNYWTAPDEPDEAFQTELDRICCRNLAIKASKVVGGMATDVVDGGMPVAVFPSLLEAVSDQSRTPQEGTAIRYSLQKEFVDAWAREILLPRQREKNMKLAGRKRKEMA